MKFRKQNIHCKEPSLQEYWKFKNAKTVWTCCKSVQKRQMSNAVPAQYQANLINMKFLTQMKMFRWNATITDWYDSVSLKRTMLSDTFL